MEKIGFKPDTKRDNAGQLIYKDKEGNEASFSDYKKALNGEDWFDKLLMKMVTGREITPKEYAEEAGKELITRGETAVAETMKSVIKPIEDIPKSIPPELQNEGSPIIGGKVEVHGQTNTTNIPGGAPKVMNTSSTKIRNDDVRSFQRPVVV